MKQERTENDVLAARLEKFEDVIAELKLVVKAGKECQDVHIQIGKPFVEQGLAHCPVAVWGMYGRLPDVLADDTLAALWLAMCLVGRLVPHYAKSANSGLYYSVDDQVPVPWQSHFPDLNSIDLT